MVLIIAIIYFNFQEVLQKRIKKKESKKKNNKKGKIDKGSDIDDEFAESKIDIDSFKDRMNKAVDAFSKELLKLRTGRPDPKMLDDVRVECYGSSSELSQIAQVSAKGAKELIVNVFDQTLTSTVINSIRNANLGLNPKDSSDGASFIIPIPKTTSETRKENVNRAKALREKTKTTLNKYRQDILKTVTKEKKDKIISDDDAFAHTKDIDSVTEDYQKKANEALKEREKQLLEN